MADEESWASTIAVRRSMQANRSRDTVPEIALRKVLHAQGLRFRVCARPLPEVRRNVDIVFRPAQVAVEVYGCFWHGCPTHYRRPAAHQTYWMQKVSRNVERDQDTRGRLAAAGWELIVVWEHEDPVEAAGRVIQVVRTRRDAIESKRVDRAGE